LEKRENNKEALVKRQEVGVRDDYASPKTVLLENLFFIGLSGISL
jgi:hypothetical protein